MLSGLFLCAERSSTRMCSLGCQMAESEQCDAFQLTTDDANCLVGEIADSTIVLEDGMDDTVEVMYDKAKYGRKTGTDTNAIKGLFTLRDETM